MTDERPTPTAPTLGDELQGWLDGDDVSLGSLVHLFGDRAFALAFVILMAPAALPIPTGGVTHVFEIIVVVLATQLLIGRSEPWIPARWRGRSVVGDGNGKLIRGLLRLVRRAERVARPRMAGLFDRRVADVLFGVLVIVGTVGAFIAPPFSGLDTLPALGVVLLSLGVLFRDIIIVAVGAVVMAAGIALELLLGAALFSVALHFWPW